MVPLEVYSDGGRCENCVAPELTTGMAAAGGGGGRHAAQHVSIGYHLGALGALSIGSGGVGSSMHAGPAPGEALPFTVRLLCVSGHFHCFPLS